MYFNMNKIICYCKNIAEDEILSAIKKGAKTLEDIKNTTGACTGNDCKVKNPNGICCSGEILKLLNSSQTTTCDCCKN